MDGVINNILQGFPSSIVAGFMFAAIMWFFSRKRKSDEIVNTFERITNDISAIKDKMTNGFDHVENTFEKVNIEREILISEFMKLNAEQKGLTEKVKDIENKFSSSIIHTFDAIIKENENRKSKPSDASTELSNISRLLEQILNR